MPARQVRAPVRGDRVVVYELAEVLGLHRTGVRRAVLRAGYPVEYRRHPDSGQRVLTVSAADAEAYLAGRAALALPARS